MKKILKTLALSLLFIPFIAGCKAPVFYEIMRDVAPEEATVNGVITSITRYKSDTEKLVTFSSDGLIWKDKDGTAHGQWSCFPNSNQLSGKIIKTAADDSNLYVVTITFHEDVEDGLNLPDAATLWCYDNNNKKWSEVSTPELLPGNFNIFCTNDVEDKNRSAYLRIGDKVYKLSGKTFDKSNPIEGNYNSVVYFSETAKDSSTENKHLKNVDNFYFFTSTASVADNTKKKIYWGEGTSLYYCDKDTEPTKSLDAGTDISCLAVTSDALLIGRGDFSNSLISKGGIAKTSLDSDGKPGNSLESFSTNATSQLASVYQIYTLLVANPEQTELEASIYASMGFKGSGSSTSVSYDNIGLWSYYKSRGNWNRE